MVNRKKLIKGLECCSSGHCTGCTYFHTSHCLTAIMEDAITALKESEVHELTREEWEHWKNAKHRDPICMIYKQDDTCTPIWVFDPNKVHEPALLMGEIKLFTGKLTFEQCKAVKWE